jgi:hypothetical protein
MAKESKERLPRPLGRGQGDARSERGQRSTPALASATGKKIRWRPDDFLPVAPSVTAAEKTRAGGSSFLQPSTLFARVVCHALRASERASERATADGARGFDSVADGARAPPYAHLLTATSP